MAAAVSDCGAAAAGAQVAVDTDGLPRTVGVPYPTSFHAHSDRELAEQRRAMVAPEGARRAHLACFFGRPRQGGPGGDTTYMYTVVEVEEATAAWVFVSVYNSPSVAYSGGSAAVSVNGVAYSQGTPFDPKPITSTEDGLTSEAGMVYNVQLRAGNNLIQVATTNDGSPPGPTLAIVAKAGTTMQPSKADAAANYKGVLTFTNDANACIGSSWTPADVPTCWVASNAPIAQALQQTCA